jgi:hypothetical protein
MRSETPRFVSAAEDGFFFRAFRIVRSFLLVAPLFAAVVTAGETTHEDGLVGAGSLDIATKCAIGRFRKCDIEYAVKKGLFETGLAPVFPAVGKCRGIDEGYAIDYASKRNRQMYHGGIDMPAPWGTPIIAVAAGTVVGKFRGERSFRGIEIVLRHSPEDTGIPLWIYTQYSHFSEMPKLEIGQHLRMGETLGPTGNSGIGRNGRQSMKRRPAIHFGVFYSVSDQYAVVQDRVIPVGGQWMDPVALFRKRVPLDSESMRALPEAAKRVPVAVMLEGGEVVPAGSKIVWPYRCVPQ